MKYFKSITLISFIIFYDFRYAQDQNIANESKNKPPIANAGDDIKTFPGATIPISGEGSTDPDGDRIQYIWSFPPSLIFEDSYKYHKSDRVKIHKNPDDNSVETIETYTRAFLLDVPEFSPIGSKYEINLIVNDSEGLSSKDSFILEVIMPDSTQISDKESDDIVVIKNKSGMKEQKDYKISIQSVSSKSIVPMQESAVNLMIYNILKDYGMDNVINPMDYIPDTLYEIREMDNIKDALQSRYNYTCLSDSCAAQNAIMQKASFVLTWTFNHHSSLLLKFFDPKDYLKMKRNYIWSASSVPIDSVSLNILKLPNSIAIDKNGDLLMASANDHSVYRIGLDQSINKLISGVIYNKELISPSGIDVDDKGKIYISDKDNNRIFSMVNEKFQNVASSKSNLNGPTTILTLDNGSSLVLCEGDQSVKKINSNGRISTVLSSGVVRGISDLAADSKGNFYVASPFMNQIFKIIRSDKVEVVAGFKKNSGLKGNNIPAKEAQLYNPVSIDFDLQDNLYILESGKGYVRTINSNGIINKVAGGGKYHRNYSYADPDDIDLRNSYNLRIGPGPKIYLSKMLNHSIISLSPIEDYNWIGLDIYQDPMHLINNSGISGLESHFKMSLPKILQGHIPKKRVPISTRLKLYNKNITDYFSARPLLFAILLVGGAQVTSSYLSDGNTLGTPPDWPF